MASNPTASIFATTTDHTAAAFAVKYVNQDGFDLIWRQKNLQEQMKKIEDDVRSIEQNANLSLAIADRGYVLQTGRIVLADKAAALLANDDLKKAYLGR